MTFANFVQTLSRPVTLKVPRLRVVLPLLEMLLATVTLVLVVTPLLVLLPRALLPVLLLVPLLPPPVPRRARVKTTRCHFKTSGEVKAL